MAYTVGSKKVIKDDNRTQLSTLTVSTSDYLEIAEVTTPPMYGSTTAFSFGGRVYPSFTATQDIYSFPFAISFPATASDTGGDLSLAVRSHGSGQSKTEGFAVGGQAFPPGNSVITSFPFAISSGTGTEVGSLYDAAADMAVVSSTTECFSCGGFDQFRAPFLFGFTKIQKFPFSISSGTTTITGDLIEAKIQTAGHANAENGFVSAGSIPENPAGAVWVKTIEKFPFSISSGTAIDVGDLTVENKLQTGCSSSTDGFSVGGQTLPPATPGSTLTVSTIEKFPFNISSGTAVDVGDFAPFGRHTGDGSSSETDGFVMNGNPQPLSVRIYSFPFAISGGTGTYVGDINPVGFFDQRNSQV